MPTDSSDLSIRIDVEDVLINGRQSSVFVRRTPRETAVYIGGEWIPIASHPIAPLRAALAILPLLGQPLQEAPSTSEDDARHLLQFCLATLATGAGHRR